MRQSMTFGVMPGFRAFSEAFREKVGDGTYDVRSGGLSSNPMEGSWSASGLYDEIRQTASHFRDGVLDIDSPKLDMCSAIMGHLGFEWI